MSVFAHRITYSSHQDPPWSQARLPHSFSFFAIKALIYTFFSTYSNKGVSKFFLLRIRNKILKDLRTTDSLLYIIILPFY